MLRSWGRILVWLEACRALGVQLLGRLGVLLGAQQQEWLQALVRE